MTPRPPLGIERWGNINARQLERGKWTANAYYRDSLGRRRRMERYGATKASAIAHLEDALHEGLTDTSAEIHAASTIEQLAVAWWPEYLDEEDPATSTRIGYRRSLDEIEALVGQLRIREATVPWLDRYLKALAAERGPSVAKRHKVLFGHMLGYAVRHGAAASNTAASTKPPTGKRAPITAPDAAAIDAMRALFAAYDDRPRTLPFLRDFADLLIATGARTSEVLALRWEDVDLEHGKLTISGTLVTDDDGKLQRQSHPKTEHGRRRLTLPDDAVGLLLSRRTRADSEWVLCARGGGLRSPNNARRSWREALDKSEHAGVTPRGYRKAVATVLARELGSQAAAEQLGHASRQTTEGYYIERLHEGPDARAVLERLRQSGE